MDTVNKSRRSQIMRLVKTANTRPELVVRRLIHRMGYRFRLHRKDLPGKPDIVLPKLKSVILVHGCFWHGCKKCDRGTRVPKTNTEFWRSKVSENRDRDARNIRDLESVGWHVIVVWACEAECVQALAERLQGELSSRVKRDELQGR